MQNSQVSLIYKPDFQCPRISDLSNETFCCTDKNKLNIKHETYLFCCNSKNFSVHREHNVYEDDTDYKYDMFNFVYKQR